MNRENQHNSWKERLINFKKKTVLQAKMLSEKIDRNFESLMKVRCISLHCSKIVM